MSGRIFLHGGGNTKANIQECITEFIGDNKVVSVLFASTPPDLFEKIKKTWESSGRGQVFHFINPEGEAVSDADIRKIEQSDAIFINGGDTRDYFRLYVTDRLRRLLRKKFLSGADIGGSSAGALLISRYCTIQGSTIHTEHETILLNSLSANDDPHSELVIGKGLDIIDISIDVHATQWGRLPRLFEQMKRCKAVRGVAIDEDTYLVMSEQDITIRGLGRAYFVRRRRLEKFQVRIFSQGSIISPSVDL